MSSELVYRLTKLATKPGYTPMPRSMLEPPVVHKDKSSSTPTTSRLSVSSLADPAPPAALDKVNKVYQANPGLKGGIPDITGGSVVFRF